MLRPLVDIPPRMLHNTGHRQFWATAFRLAATMRRGSIMPATSEIYPEFAYCQDEADKPMAFGIA